MGKAKPAKPTYAFCLCLTRTGKLTHFGLDAHPSMIAGHPRQTLCGRPAVPLPMSANPWADIGYDIECQHCLHAAPEYMTATGWKSVKAALAVFRNRHRVLARKGANS